MEHFALGIDIGGTTTTFGLVDQKGSVQFEKVIPTKDYPSADTLLKEIEAILKEENLLRSLVGIGIGAPNGNSQTGQIEFAPNLLWKGIVPICSMAMDIFHLPCLLINDANAAAVGEKMFGAAKNESHFVTITLGTGLGSGIFINNELVEGAHGFAGEFGHIRIIQDGRSCGCGRKGCLETYASSTGVVRTYELFTSNANKLNKEVVSAKEIFDKAAKGDAMCQEVVEYTASILGNALADFACFSDPKMYVLFGGIAQSGDAFTKRVQHYMDANLLKVLQGKVQVVTSQLHNQNAAVLGTAASIFWKILKNNNQ
ncbi:MAG: ROK family protein [Bacteroidetes bacterium]|nr:ROK family protein [Bacteroidota bacterium]